VEQGWLGVTISPINLAFAISDTMFKSSLVTILLVFPMRMSLKSPGKSDGL
jgi:hypothetical protein